MVRISIFFVLVRLIDWMINGKSFFLQLVGVTAEQMQKKETMDFIYDFVEKRGGIDNVIREIKKEKATELRKLLIFLFFSS